MSDNRWMQFYQTKVAQHARNGKCYGCGGPATDSDHLFVNRGMGGHDEAELQEDWNIATLCNACNVARLHETAVRAALDKLWAYGPDYLEERILSLERKVSRGLPGFYLDALELYDRGKKPF